MDQIFALKRSDAVQADEISALNMVVGEMNSTYRNFECEIKKLMCKVHVSTETPQPWKDGGDRAGSV